MFARKLIAFLRLREIPNLENKFKQKKNAVWIVNYYETLLKRRLLYNYNNT